MHSPPDSSKQFSTCSSSGIKVNPNEPGIKVDPNETLFVVDPTRILSTPATTFFSMMGKFVSSTPL